MAPGEQVLSREVADTVRRVAAVHGVRAVRVFGSVARRQQTPDSDLDLLVDMEPRRSLFDLVAFAQDLEEALGRHVDAVTEKALSPYLRDRILAEALPL
jgi:hypothetical protein